MEAERIAMLTDAVKKGLQAHGLQFRFRDRGFDHVGMTFSEHPNYNTGEYIELEAIKRGKRGECTFARIIQTQELAQEVLAKVAERFCAQAANALKDVEVR